MKLRNKKTGEIGYPYFQNWKEISCVIVDENAIQIAEYTSLAELNAEWEDYDESKEYWYIDPEGTIICEPDDETPYDDYRKQIGNYFDTREEAEKAVEKLKAWKRLEDKGFSFDHIRSIDGVSINHKDLDQYTIIAYADEDGCDQEYLDLLFGGKE